MGLTVDEVRSPSRGRAPGWIENTGLVLGARARLLMAGAAISLAAAVAYAASPERARTISFYHIHTKETLTVTYKRDGKFVPDALKQINWLMRDWRENKAIEMDPNTIDIIWEMHEELGSKEPVHVICGHRSGKTNEMLRRTVGGQASQSQHITGKAIDIAFPDIPARQLRYSAMVRERGGVGYYPTSAIPFVHVDTSRVRHWPNMPKNELALLFPSGHTQHHPAEGGSLSPSDVRDAKAKGGETATQVAAYFALKDTPKQTILLADAGGATLAKLVPPAPQPAVRPTKPPAPEQRMALAAPMPTPQDLQWRATPRPEGAPPSIPVPAAVAKAPVSAAPAPKIVSEPKLAERPSRFVPAPSEADRKGLNALVAAAGPAEVPISALKPPAVMASLAPPAPQPAVRAPDLLGKPAAAAVPLETETSWAPAPEFDDDHPEELAYRPFPLAPLLTATPSADDAALSVMQHPQVSKTLVMLDAEMTSPPMRLRPGQQMTELLWSKEFRGLAVDLADLAPERAQPNTPQAVTDRLVKTTSR